MEYQIRNKWVSLGGSSEVLDAQGNPVMKVKGKVFSFTRKKYLTDLDDNVKYIIRNKYWSFFTHYAYIMDENEQIKATIRRKIFSFHDRYSVNCEFGAMEIVGNIFQFDYHIILNGKEIGHVARKISLRDSFFLTAEDDCDPNFLMIMRRTLVTSVVS